MFISNIIGQMLLFVCRGPRSPEEGGSSGEEGGWLERMRAADAALMAALNAQDAEVTARIASGAGGSSS